MMRSPKAFVVAVRRPDGTIAVREQAWRALLPNWKLLRWPFFRGALVLLESMHNGFSALKFSADYALPPEEGGVSLTSSGTPATAAPGEATSTGAASSRGEPAPAAESSGASSTWMLGLATAVMVALFIALPHALTYGLGRWFGPAMDTSGALFHLVDGLIRVVILVGYILAISRTEDAERLFQYHGAEHKAIWAYESGKPLTVESAQGFTTLHPRCGTSFLFVVVSVAVLLHIAVIPWVPTLHPSAFVNQALLVLLKVAMAFPIAGIAYELQRLSAKESCPAIIRWLARPGMWMQRITTREPTREQLEIAVLALAKALAREEGAVAAAEAEGVRIYPDFAVAQAAPAAV